MGILVAALVAAGSLGVAPRFTVGAESPNQPQRLIVVFDDSAPAGAEDLIRGMGARVVRRIPQIGVLVVEPDGRTLEDLADALSGLPSVHAVGRDLAVSLALPGGPDEPGLSGEVSASGHVPPEFGFPIPPSAFDALYLAGQQWSITRVGADAVWPVSDGSGATIAFLDSGISAVHPDIAPNLLSAVSLVDVSGDDPRCDDGSEIDQLGHGTLVASLAAGARGPGTGFVLGVAPGAKIRSYKVLRRTAIAAGPPPANTAFNRCLFGVGSGEFSWLLEGLTQAVDDGADIIVISAGGFVDRRNHADLEAAYTSLLRATNRAFARGVLVVAAAGNNHLDLNTLGPLVHLPSELPNVLSVSATTNPSVPPPGRASGIDYLASYSNFGSSLHGLAAPGGESAGTAADRLVRGACSSGIPDKPVGLPPQASFGCFFIGFPGTAPSIDFNHVSYARNSGTSFAAPHVAGVAALVKSANPALTASQIRAILLQTAADLGKPGYDELFNFGLVRAPEAVEQAIARALSR